MNRSYLLFPALSLLLFAGCTKPNSTSSPSPQGAVQAPATVSAAATTASATPGGALQPSMDLDIQEVAKELPTGVTLAADQKGRPDSALSFTGEESHVQLPWDINPTAHPQLTITAWARFTGDPALEARQQVISHDDGGYDRGVGLDPRAGQWGWSSFVGTGEVIGGAPVKPGEWTFLAVTYDQTAKSASLTVDDATFNTKTESINDAGNPYLWIGGNPGFGEHFVGDIAHLQIFDRVLTSEELKSIREQ